MKSYIVTTESTQKADKEILMLIIKALAKAGIKTTQAGVQKVKAISLEKIKVTKGKN